MAHDHIVIGAGSAGAALAAGLAEQHGSRVLLLEAGPRDRDPRVRVPAAAADLWFSRLDWAYETEPQPGLAGRRDTWPRGRVLGGSSSINAMMYVRGLDVDYDDWAAAGATGWDAAAMRAAFVAMEDDERGPAPHRGVGGPVRVEHQRDPSPLSEAFLAACEELGLPRVEDYPLAPDGCGLTMVTQRDGRRWSAADAFLRDPAPSLTIRTGVEVVRIVVEQGRAVGVDVLVDGRRRFARAEQEVLVCAGAVGSPHLLLRSGIGPADELRALGIEVVADAPGVGRDLQDHVLGGIAAGTAGQSLFGADRDPRAVLRYLRHRRGPLTSNLGEAIGFLRTREGEPGPDVELIALPVALRDHGRVRYPQHGITLGAILLRPRSRGRITLASADPHTAPIIDPGTFSDPDGDDLARLRDGVRFCQQLLLDTRALGRRVTGLIEPDRRLEDDTQLDAHVRGIAQTLYHPVGTCRMGSDDDAVVDPELRVRGVAGLRVADASVMPNLIRGHTNAPAIAIGRRAVSLVAGPTGA